MTPPPFTITAAILHRVAEISESLGRLSVQQSQSDHLRLRWINRIRTIQGSLAIVYFITSSSSSIPLPMAMAVWDGFGKR